MHIDAKRCMLLWCFGQVVHAAPGVMAVLGLSGTAIKFSGYRSLQPLGRLCLSKVAVPALGWIWGLLNRQSTMITMGPIQTARWESKSQPFSSKLCLSLAAADTVDVGFVYMLIFNVPKPTHSSLSLPFGRVE
ncbi:hypothetical protein EX30DRAFT_127985 [Ascodesmis nigricans]|uniref:Uncharacterized protein n=1 Tax=Ascodesmis nigricans TaxID=341454 RepID=A0A4S2MP64_9PEZI|nr:hypothetical protein EX30DRAFT_127985 [Ascodesmis nigricans]